MSAALEQANRLQQKASNPAANVWVTANAGTGKTKVLTDRVLRLLLTGVPPGRILCLTYTKAAAAEMRNRIGAKLSEWATAGEADLDAMLETLDGAAANEDAAALRRRRARQLFATVLDDAVGLRIDTIHAFCQDVLKRFPVEAGVAPHFDVLVDRDAADMRADARRAVLTRANSPESKDDDRLNAALATMAAQVRETGFGDLIDKYLSRQHDLAELMVAPDWPAILAAALDLPEDPSEEKLLARYAALPEAKETALRSAVGALHGDGGKRAVERAEKIAAWLNADSHGREAGMELYARAFLTGEDQVTKQLVPAGVAKGNPAAAEALLEEGQRMQGFVGARRAVRLYRLNHAALTLAFAVIEDFNARKDAAAALDYADLIERVGRLLAGGAIWVHYKLDQGISHVLVDEAQDTSPQQWALVQRLTDDFFAGADAHTEAGVERTVFVVGDPKQSIFSFQGADRVAFEESRNHFEAAAGAAGRPLEPVPLNVSFRSTPAVLEGVDKVFATPAARRGVDDDVISHLGVRDDQSGSVTLWPLLHPDEAADEEPWELDETTGLKDPTEQLARHLAREIHRWTRQGGMQVWRNKMKPDEGMRPARPSDVLILVRRRRAFVRMVVRELKALDVPVAGVDRMMLLEQLPVQDLLVLLDFLLLPSDDLALATVLKSPFIGLSEEDLFELAARREQGEHLWPRLRAAAAGNPAFARAEAWLSGLLATADFVPPYDFFADLLDGGPVPGPVDVPEAERRSGRRAFRARLGPEADDPLDELLNLALIWQRENPPSLQAFLHWIRAGDTEIKRDLDTGPEGGGRDEVRVMTVHGAKGLQAPIVILGDTVSLPDTSQDPILWRDFASGGNRPAVPIWAPNKSLRDPVAEDRRTRLEADILDEYNRLLYVAMTRAEDQLIVAGVAGKANPRDGNWHQLVEAGLAETDPFTLALDGATVEGGWHFARGQDGDHGSAEPAPEATSSLEAAWLFREAEPEPEPTVPLAPSRPADEEPPVYPPLAPDDSHRFRRGLAIHRLLETLPALPAANRAAAADRYLARRSLGFDESERQEIRDETLAVLETADFAALFGPGSRAEVPLTGAVGGYVVSGVIDRLLVTDAEVAVIDFKTNRPPPEQVDGVPAAYLHQMATYRHLLREIYPGRPVRCGLLWTTNLNCMWLPAPLLDSHLPTLAAAELEG